jgi:hypothetical protein
LLEVVRKSVWLRIGSTRIARALAIVVLDNTSRPVLFSASADDNNWDDG